MSYILLVEDNQSHADMTIRILVSAGYEVKHVLRGFDGAQLARKHRPAIILMDFDLPDINGRTMAFILKKQLGANAAPPIIAVTARAGEDEMRMASHFGCSAFVSKPFLPEDLLSVIARFVPPPAGASATPIPAPAQPVGGTTGMRPASTITPPPTPLTPAAIPAATPVPPVAVAQPPTVPPPTPPPATSPSAASTGQASSTSTGPAPVPTPTPDSKGK